MWSSNGGGFKPRIPCFGMHMGHEYIVQRILGFRVSAQSQTLVSHKRSAWIQSTNMGFLPNSEELKCDLASRNEIMRNNPQMNRICPIYTFDVFSIETFISWGFQRPRLMVGFLHGTFWEVGVMITASHNPERDNGAELDRCISSGSLTRFVYSTCIIMIS